MSGGVSVKSEMNARDLGLGEHSRMVFSESGSLRGNGLEESGAMAGDDIELSFADERPLGFTEGLPCDMEAIEDASLVEEVGLGAVDILSAFWRIGAEDSSGERHDFSQFVADGEHQAISETVMDAFGVLFVLDAESSGEHQRA